MFRAEHPHLSEWKDVSFRYFFVLTLQRGRRMTHPYHWPPSEEPRAQEPVACGSCRVQVVRSAADWSHGCLTENSIQREWQRV